MAVDGKQHGDWFGIPMRFSNVFCPIRGKQQNKKKTECFDNGERFQLSSLVPPFNLKAVRVSVWWVGAYLHGG
jgi:hypothetical protein